jgi:calcineurin-like phosphoesterase family protein
LSEQFGHLEDAERDWLRATRRSAARRTRLVLAVPLVLVMGLVWVALGERSTVLPPAHLSIAPAAPNRPAAPAAQTPPSAEQRALDDGRRALAAWGRFAVTNHLDTLHDWFWTDGPQYRQLAREAKLRRGTKALGPPAYHLILSRAQVLSPSPRDRVLRGRVRVTRPGEAGQSYGWDVWMRRDTVGDRWRLWTVKPTRATPARSLSDPVVVAAGDIAQAAGHQQATADRIAEIDPDAVLLLGDLQYPNGDLADFRRLYHPTWGRFKATSRPSPGNHEYHTPAAAGYLDYFGRAARPAGRSYYSFDLGGWHVIALNSNIPFETGSAQERWLRADLVATSKRCILAYWHHPRFSSGSHEGDHVEVGPLWTDLYDARADVVLNGHEHSYERFARQDPRGRADRQGIRQFVVGTGGAALQPLAAARPNSQLRTAAAHGVLELVLHPASYEWRFVAESGAVLDRGGPVTCH